MGYYTGSGIASGGTSSTKTLKTFAIMGGGSFSVRQKSVSHSIKMPGVSLEYAKSKSGSDNLSAVTGGSGSLSWIIFDAEGTRTTTSYTQISDSNLYELTETTETLTAYASGTKMRNLT